MAAALQLFSEQVYDATTSWLSRTERRSSVPMGLRNASLRSKTNFDYVSALSSRLKWLPDIMVTRSIA